MYINRERDLFFFRPHPSQCSRTWNHRANQLSRVPGRGQLNKTKLNIFLVTCFGKIRSTTTWKRVCSNQPQPHTQRSITWVHNFRRTFTLPPPQPQPHTQGSITWVRNFRRTLTWPPPQPQPHPRVSGVLKNDESVALLKALTPQTWIF